MKKNVCLLLALLLALACLSAAAEENEPIEISCPQTGILITLPGDFDACSGLVSMPSDGGEIDFGMGVYIAYSFYLPRTMDEYLDYLAMTDICNQMEDGEEKDELAAQLQSFHQFDLVLFEVYGIDGGRTLEDLAALKDVDLDGLNPAIPLGSLNDTAYFLFTADLDDPRVAEMMAEHPNPEPFLAELRKQQSILAADPGAFRLIEREEGFRPIPSGEIISFETVDLAGNPVRSQELFARNKVTLVNIWRTWCGYCVQEFPEMEEMSREWAQKGGAIVTYCADANTEELIQTARDLTQPYSFLTLIYSESIGRALPFPATPLTYFVDSQGAVLGLPILGARPAAYVERMAAYLNDEAAEETAPAGLIGESSALTVTVTDQEGAPVPGAYVSFCGADACELRIADENGRIVYENGAAVDHLVLVAAPAGYSLPEQTEIPLPENAGSLTLTIRKD